MTPTGTEVAAASAVCLGTGVFLLTAAGGSRLWGAILWVMQISGGEGYDGSQYSLDQAKDTILRKIRSDPYGTYTRRNVGSTVGMGYGLCTLALDALVAGGYLEKSPYMPRGAREKDYCYHLPGEPSNRAREYAASQRKEAIASQERLALGEVDVKPPLPRSGPDKVPRVVEHPGHPTRPGETEAVILAYIKANPGASSPDICAATGFSSGKVGGPLWRLEHERKAIYPAGKQGRTRMFVAYDTPPEPEAEKAPVAAEPINVTPPATIVRTHTHTPRAVVPKGPRTLVKAGWLRCDECTMWLHPELKEHRCK